MHKMCNKTSQEIDKKIFKNKRFSRFKKNVSDI